MKICPYKIIKIKLKELTARERIEWSDKQIAMTNEIITGYNPRKGFISISKNNEVLNGNHRYKILIDHYGGDYEVIVKKKPFAKRYYTTQKILWLILLLPVLLPYAIIKTLVSRIK